MGPYHAIMVHFPVALWTVAPGIIIFRGVSEGPLARAFDRVLVSLLFIGVATGLVAYVLGQEREDGPGGQAAQPGRCR